MRITAEQAAQALNISLSTITNYVKILKIKKETINGRVSIALASDDFLSIAKRVDSIHRTTEKQELAKKYLSGKKNGKTSLLSMQQEHPLIKEPKMFITGWFPPIDSYEFLTECNTVKTKGAEW